MLPIKEVHMPRLLFLLITTVFLVGSAAQTGSAESLPHPAGLEPQVQFWIRVYSEVDTKSGLIHDSRHLDVVYEVIHFSDKTSRRSRDRATEAAKKKYAKALRSLAKGKRTNLTLTEEHVLALWPEGVTNSTLSGASKRLRFQLGQADKFKAGLVRSGAWKPYIRKVFTEQGVPVEISALPHVESSFNPTSYSRVGAAGMWQFMRSTGRRYLQVDYAVDERLDPYKSTDAAARLLKDNYAVTKSWPLAITAYNHGATGMKRAVKKLGTSDIDTIVKKYESRTFGFASRNFYTELLAASHVDENSMKYFGALKFDKPVVFESVQIKHYYPFAALQKALGIPSAELKRYNPSLRNPVLTGRKHVPKKFVLHVPGGVTHPAAVSAISGIADNQRYSTRNCVCAKVTSWQPIICATGTSSASVKYCGYRVSHRFPRRQAALPARQRTPARCPRPTRFARVIRSRPSPGDLTFR
jgi:membrane-bound lytic murein transglycosylase D